MRKLMLTIPVLLSMLVLSSCDEERVQKIIAGVQTYTERVCGFRTTAVAAAAVVGSFFTNWGDIATIINMIGNAICTSPVAQAGVRRGGTVTRFVTAPNGQVIVVRGYFVR